MKKRYFAAVLAASIMLGGCATEGGGTSPMTHTKTGAIIGAVGGAAIGAMAYRKNRTRGALVGAVGGGLAGAVVGTYMDNQKRDLEQNLADEIRAGQARVEKLPNNVVRVTMTSQTAFDVDSADIKPGFNSTMNKLADVVVRYNKTALTIVGHTDSTGSDQYNQKLSERRAVSVARYLESKRVNGLRLAVAGKGESEPLANNSTESGRAANRRVEIYVEPVVES